jgi:hypothetical protein
VNAEFVYGWVIASDQKKYPLITWDTVPFLVNTIIYVNIRKRNNTQRRGSVLTQLKKRKLGMRIWIAPKSDSTIFAHCFKRHGKPTHQQGYRIHFSIYPDVQYQVHGDNKEARKHKIENLSLYIPNIAAMIGMTTDLPQTLIQALLQDSVLPQGF